MTTATLEIREEALSRARNGASMINYPDIIRGFMEKGLVPDDIKPRENVFTFHAWKALGRHVRKGEHGVKILTWIPTEETKKDAKTGEEKPITRTRPRTAVVFHVSQTDQDERK